MNSDITFSLPDALIEQAQKAGILTRQKIEQLLSDELKKLSIGQELSQLRTQSQQEFFPEYGHLTDDEVMAIVNEEIQEMRKDVSGTE